MNIIKNMSTEERRRFFIECALRGIFGAVLGVCYYTVFKRSL